MSDIAQVGEFNGMPVFSYAPDKRPLAVGDVLHGFCGGIFGRDHYDCSVVEAVGPDWVVVRNPGAETGTGLGLATGRKSLADLRQYRKRVAPAFADELPCCAEDGS